MKLKLFIPFVAAVALALPGANAEEGTREPEGATPKPAATKPVESATSQQLATSKLIIPENIKRILLEGHLKSLTQGRIEVVPIHPDHLSKKFIQPGADRRELEITSIYEPKAETITKLRRMDIGLALPLATLADTVVSNKKATESRRIFTAKELDELLTLAPKPGENPAVFLKKVDEEAIKCLKQLNEEGFGECTYILPSFPGEEFPKTAQVLKGGIDDRARLILGSSQEDRTRSMLRRLSK